MKREGLVVLQMFDCFICVTVAAASAQFCYRRVRRCAVVVGLFCSFSFTLLSHCCLDDKMKRLKRNRIKKTKKMVETLAKQCCCGHTKQYTVTTK